MKSTTTTTTQETNDYLEFRGKCKEMSEAEVLKDPTLRLVRGYYHDAAWGTQPHWWCERPDGSIVDPTARQFPSKGKGVYEEFDGYVECEACGKTLHEDDAQFAGNYPVCNYTCYGRLVL